MFESQSGHNESLTRVLVSLGVYGVPQPEQVIGTMGFQGQDSFGSCGFHRLAPCTIDKANPVCGFGKVWDIDIECYHPALELLRVCRREDDHKVLRPAVSRSVPFTVYPAADKAR